MAHSRFRDGVLRTRNCLVLGRLSVATGHVYSLHLTVMSVTCSQFEFGILDLGDSPETLIFYF